MNKNNQYTFLIDWDGTIFIGERPVLGAFDLYSFMKALNARIIYLTNNSSKNSKEYKVILKKHNLWNNNCQIVTSGKVAAWYISQVLKINEIFIIGTDSLIKELKSFGVVSSLDSAKLVLIGFDKTLTYDKIQKGHELICKGLPFYATHDDKVCPCDNFSYVDCGSIIEIFKKSTDIEPVIIGKPYIITKKYLLETCNLNLGTTYLIGDKHETDGKLANDLGIKFYQINSKDNLSYKHVQNEIIRLNNHG
ncbi:MAG: HAD hydrolase-like protein [Lentimicrobiaceae bacterium]|nr:HAD hydrolase-like protein [Lentimicrobiaceae bacterium]